MNYKEAYENGINKLSRVGIPDAGLDARLLLEYVCNTSHSTLYAHPDKELTEKEEKDYEALIARREGREPVAYILGNQDFMGLNFRVNENVLIPEQDTENLVEEALRFCEDGMRVLDLCTGSGCIALSILNFSNDTKAVCTDISDKALAIATENSERLGLKERAEFIHTDLFPPKDGSRYDLVVSNPPYIASDVIETLAPEVKDFEPRLALDGDDDGLSFYRRIVNEVPEYLYSNGYLIMEIGYDQGQAVKELLEQDERYHDIEVIKDYSGNDRVVRACFY
ncbi:release factor glutamine methyltransferase [Butyrivibrio proteoclasticus]|uniref:Release factor glutamine methyltransferase n=1 Tax=Butyrivibrio proteoclasticus TaxID=43305 RepID=A0A1I5R4N5_9FIRM|nr:peptide chain release factor N(5)-glutamine methyltransferase [Butyrivibrio proteoclasticus]SFP53261.1 release factor glutamine methyltransferase [Butyrivibrio proteoclasticus]